MSEWAFLDQSFQTLKGAVCIHYENPNTKDQHEVRLGRNDQPLWIRVRIDDVHAMTPALRSARCHLLHEALVLTSILAVVDYDTWREAMVSTCELRIRDPTDAGFFTPARRLQPRYFVYASTNWTTIQELLVNRTPSNGFQDHVASVLEIAARRGVAVDSNTALCFPVRVAAGPSGDRDHQVAHLRSLIETVVMLQDLEDYRPAACVLLLDSLDLQLRMCDIHSAVLGEILELVETGVWVSYLQMPAKFPYDGHLDSAARWTNWALLACAVCGRPQRTVRRAVHVEKLVLDAFYSCPEMFPSLLSVLREARTLTYLKLSASSTFLDPDSMFWYWLGYALFRPDSACTVEVLNLNMIELSPVAIANVRDAVTAPIPLDRLWKNTVPLESELVPRQEAKRSLTIVVPAGTSIRRYGHGLNTWTQFVAPVDWEGNNLNPWALP